MQITPLPNRLIEAIRMGSLLMNQLENQMAKQAEDDKTMELPLEEEVPDQSS